MPRHTPTLPTVCASCGANIRGRVRAVRRPGATAESGWEQSGGRTPLCTRCASDNVTTCASCDGEFYPTGEMILHSGRRYCYGCDPTPHCGQCGGHCSNGDTVRFTNRSGVEFHFCSSSCAEDAGFTYDGGWRRNYGENANDEVEIVQWEPADHPYFKIHKGPTGHLTFGIEVEGKMHHAPDEWDCVRDESMWYGGGDCWEIVSPIMRGPLGARAARGALRTWAFDSHPRPSIAKNAGVHVHVGVNWADREFIARLVDHWEFWGEDFAAGLVTASRMSNQFCGSIKGQSQGHWVRSLNFDGPCTGNGAHLFSRYDRRKSMNLASIAKHGTIEFRLFNASTDPRKIMGWTTFCVNFVALVARLPRGFSPRRMEYLCKRYGVMRVGLRLIEGGTAFDTWTRERWDVLNDNERLSEDHMCHPNFKPWGGDKDTPRRRRIREDTPLFATEQGAVIADAIRNRGATAERSYEFATMGTDSTFRILDRNESGSDAPPIHEMRVPENGQWFVNRETGDTIRAAPGVTAIQGHSAPIIVHDEIAEIDDATIERMARGFRERLDERIATQIHDALTEECSTCHGQGWIDDPTATVANEHGTPGATCPVCQGRGRVDPDLPLR